MKAVCCPCKSRVEHPCPGGGAGSKIFVEQYNYSNGTKEQVGYFAGRCQDRMKFATGEVYPFGPFWFDEKAGTILFPVDSLSGDSAYPQVEWVALIQGLTTEFDVFQTFAPTGDTLGFRVPYMPEGMGGADHFDTYWGKPRAIRSTSRRRTRCCAATP